MIAVKVCKAHWAFFLCALIVVGLVLWGCGSPDLSSPADTYLPPIYHQGWSQQVGDTWVPLADIQDYVDTEESLIFSCTLPELDDDQVFLFYTVNKEVRCYVDGVMIQDFTMQDGYTDLDTPGSAWNQVDLTSAMSGKECILSFHSPLGQYQSLCNIYMADNQYVNTIRLDNIWSSVVSAIGIFFIMLVLATTCIVVQQPHRRRYLLAIAQYFFLVLLWLLAELNFYDIFLSRPIISYLLGEVFKRLMPLALLYLAKRSTNQYWHPRIFKGLIVLAWVNVLLPLALQFTLGISLLQLSVIHSAIALIVSLAILSITAKKAIRFKQLRYEEYPCLALPILVVAGGVDNIIAYMADSYHPFLGTWTAVGCIVFSFVTLILLTHISARVVQEKLEMEESCRTMENSALVKQVEAHFIFNALNTISALCKTDPVQADHATKTFAAYLRAYLRLVREYDNIPVAKELEFVRHYLNMQKMRYGDRLDFSFDTEFLDFAVPPFVVHTLVENSIVHGVDRQIQGGAVAISIQKTTDTVTLTVSDTGYGFDVDAPIKETSVGLRNTKRRLQLMGNGTLSIESAKGRGTTAIITIPLK